ncbi:hypothetical protein GGX14DRAFT_697039 [Mycena pura]|uniref:Uncharacterized protein n=1 Tax=Mycena pura TaxID=153505 RepID=A0AAD6VI25_9AGAR|nr:hypothetical protein GGX14DRAFT_697039 [Mycena pura]
MGRIRLSTPGDSVLSRALILGLIIPGFVLTVALLAMYGYAAWNLTSRPHLNRVSFRLLVYALVAHVAFCIAFSVGTLTSTLKPPLCDSIAFVMNISLMFSAGMFFSVALNLPLYTNDMTCWYRNGDHMLEWVVGTQTAVLLLTSTGEVLSFLTILRYVVAYELETQHFRRIAGQPGTGSGTFATTAASRTSPVGSTILLLRNIILRIGLYPLVSCLLNISSCLLDLHVIQSPEPTELNWRVNLADLSIYSARPLIYGLLAATDPSFIRAIQALRHPPSEGSVSVEERVSRFAGTGTGYLSTVIEMPETDLTLTISRKHPHRHPNTRTSTLAGPEAWPFGESSEDEDDSRSVQRPPNTADVAPGRIEQGQVPRTAENDDVVRQI